MGVKIRCRKEERISLEMNNEWQMLKPDGCVTY
jgi:hypothetical protein